MDNLLDSTDYSCNYKIIQGKYFPGAVLFSIPVISLLFFLVVQKFHGDLALILAPIFLYFGILPFTNQWGVEIDTTNKGVRNYTTLGFFKRGKWISLNRFPDISIMSFNQTIRMSDAYFNSSEFKETKVGVYLLTSSHRKKLVLKTFDCAKEAKQFAKEISITLNKPLARFNPKLYK